jgi:hypothetical protein
VDSFLRKINAKWDVVEHLVNEGRLVELEYEEKRST